MLSMIFSFVESILGSAGAGEESVNIVSQVFGFILGLLG